MARVQKKIPELVGVSKKERSEAWRAASKFRDMQPQLTSFARSVTGNGKVQVHATHQTPYSVGNKIFIRPPLALGRDYAHDRQVCGRRGYDGRQECNACRVREVVDFYLYHEIGHVWLGTQDKPTTDDWNLFETIVGMWHPREACNHLDELYSRAKQYNEVMPLANIFNRYLGMILNALEDSRVNEGMFDARPGLRRVFEVNIERMMSQGFDSDDPEEARTWHDAPADSQFVVGLSMLACNYPPDGWFHPDVVEALTDPRVLDVTSRARHVDSIHEVFKLAVRALLVANEMGFCIIPKCEVPSLDNEPEDPDAGTEPGDAGGSIQPPSPSSSGGSDMDSSGTAGANGSGEAASPGEDGLPGGTEAEVPGTEGAPDEDDSTPEGSQCDVGEQSTPGTDGSGASPQPDPADDAEADEADATGGQGVGGKDDDAGSEGADEPKSGGTQPDGSDRPEEQAGPEGSSSSEPGSSAGNSAHQERDDSPTESGTSDAGEDGDGDVPSTEQGSDGQDGTEDGESDPENQPGAESHNTDPWSVAAPEETGSDDDPLPLSGTIEDAEKALAPFLMHGTEDYDGMLEEMLGEALEDILRDVEEGTEEFIHGQPLILIAISQVAFFDEASAEVAGVEVVKFPCENIGWVAEEDEDWTNYSPNEMTIGAAVLHARRVFQANLRSKTDRNRTSGRVNTRVLAKRAPVGDDRLFGKKVNPKKRSYLVIITGDCSGSTQSFGRSAKIRRAMMAQGDLLHRIGVPFVMMGHSAARSTVAQFSGYGSSDYWTYMLMIKEENEGWGVPAKNRLAAMGPVSENLDGHTLEYCRKLADKSNATDVVIIYYTDGEMPAANATEEREVLRREIKTCKKKGYHLLGVGINTDSPKRYGMKTVRIDSDEDIKLVISQLEEELTA